jgi:hypothetical protein
LDKNWPGTKKIEDENIIAKTYQTRKLICYAVSWNKGLRAL